MIYQMDKIIPKNHNIPYISWGISFVFGIVAIVLIYVLHSIFEGQIPLTSSEEIDAIYNVFLFFYSLTFSIGFFVWYGLLWTQKEERAFILYYGMIGFIIVAIISIGLIALQNAIIRKTSTTATT